MKKILAAALLVALGAPAMAVTCTSQSTWTSLGPPGSVNFGQAFGSAGSYTDCYTFSLSSGANSSGTTLENNLLFDKLYIDVTSASIFSGAVSSTNTTSGAALQSDGTPDKFSFSNLGGGTYTLAIASTVGTNWFSLYNAPVSYTGTMSTVAIAGAVPEGDALMMTLGGLLAVTGGTAAARRRRS
jgi:hypothetical protein